MFRALPYGLRLRERRDTPGRPGFPVVPYPKPDRLGLASAIRELAEQQTAIHSRADAVRQARMPLKPGMIGISIRAGTPAASPGLITDKHLNSA